MKKFSLFVVCVLFLNLALLPVSYADKTFDLSPYNSSGVFTIDVNTDNEVAFIETDLSSKDTSFEHKYENDYYSTIKNDILVIDYFSSNRYPVLRTWITYNGTKPLYINSVTFITEDGTYTFTDVADKERITIDSTGAFEQLLIRYGSKNSDFFAEIAAISVAYANEWRQDNQAATPEVKMILHGVEDLETTLPQGFFLDMAIFILRMLTDDDLGYIVDNQGTPCKVK